MSVIVGRLTEIAFELRENAAYVEKLRAKAEPQPREHVALGYLDSWAHYFATTGLGRAGWQASIPEVPPAAPAYLLALGRILGDPGLAAETSYWARRVVKMRAGYMVVGRETDWQRIARLIGTSEASVIQAFRNCVRHYARIEPAIAELDAWAPAPQTEDAGVAVASG